MSCCRELVDKIVDSVLYSGNQLIVDFNFSTRKQNQMLMLIKPEVFLPVCKNKLTGSVTAIMNVLKSYEVDIDGVYSFTSEELQKGKLMEQHYRLIDIMSRQSSRILDEHDRANIYDALDIKEAIPILGGHEYLQLDKSVDASVLNKKWMAGVISKIRNGLYVQKFEEQGNNTILVNGFYPAQLERFTKNNRHTVALLINSDLPWKILRRYMLGSTFPEKAEDGSIRNILYVNGPEYGLDNVNVANNCVHLSAGPFEAMFEISNILQYIEGKKFTTSSLNLVRTLESLDVDHRNYDISFNNPKLIIGGHEMELFDVTEEVDTYTAALLYRKCINSGIN